MRAGICAYWFNRGQGVVARQVRSALDELGHDTFVLARPTRAKNIRPAFIDRSGVWDQAGITEASQYRIPPREVVAWARDSALDVALFDQNYEFEAIEALRGAGVRTAGRFVWEQFAPQHVEPAKRAFDVIYSLTECEQERYASMGIESPRIPWGIHPELLEHADARGTEEARAHGRLAFFYPAGFLSARKPLPQLVRAFRRVPGEGVSLVVKGQVERQRELLDRAVRRDPRIEMVLADLPTDEHLRLFGAADVCVAPSRWEGLGLHLYEAMALGLPVITNDNPPMNEVIVDGANGLLVRGWRRGRAKSGIPAYVPSVRGLTAAMRRCLDAELLVELRRGVAAARDRLIWERTVAGYRDLLEELR